MPEEEGKKSGSIAQIAIAAVIAVCVGGTSPWWFKELFSKDVPSNKSEASSSLSGSPSGGDRGSTGRAPEDTGPSLPNNVERVYRGTSYVATGNLPLTLSLKRNGNSLTGSAQTPGDWDDLSGTIQSDGTFDVSGNNRLAGGVSGYWRGRIDERGEINGVWTSVKGKRIRFYAR